MAGGRELFVYWKVAAADAAAALADAAAWLAEARHAHQGLVARLYRRSGSRPEEVTVMETYARPVTGLDEALIATLTGESAARLGRWAPGGRHVEVFEPLPD